MDDVTGYELYERHGIDLRDVYTKEQLKEIRLIKEEDRYSYSLSMDSLGLTWRDFF